MTEPPQLLQARDHLDGEISNWIADYQAGAGRIWCARGCSACCSLVVTTTWPEAAAIAARLGGDQRAALQAYLTRLRELLPEVTDFKAFLRAHRRQLGNCPFLDAEGCCAIYPERPLSCRALLSTRPADWCAVDFTTLHETEQRAFLASLDPAVVDYPSHYLAASRRLARRLEQELLAAMRAERGFALGGHLPSLVWLTREHALENLLADGPAAVSALAASLGLDLPGLLHYDGQP